MKYISRLILTEQEAKDHISDYEKWCSTFREEEDPRPQFWKVLTCQEKIDYMHNNEFWFQGADAGIDVVDVLRSVEIV